LIDAIFAAAGAERDRRAMYSQLSIPVRHEAFETDRPPAL
jgi:hypothetical protein